MATTIGALRVELSANIAKFEAAMGKAAKQMARTQRKFAKFGSQASAAGRSLSVGLTAPLVAVGALSAKSFLSFERGMNNVAAVSGATEAEMAELTAIAKDLGATTSFSAAQAAEGLGFLAQAGFDATEAGRALPGVLQLAAAGGIELAAAADIATNVLAGYGLEVDQLARVNDVLAKASISTNTNVQQLGEAFKFSGAVASSAGISFEEAGAAMALMGNAGIQAEMAGTSLQQAIFRLVKPTNEAAGVMEKLGIHGTDAHGRLLPLDQIVEQLEPHFKNTAAMATIFGSRAIKGMGALVAEGSDKLRDLTTELEHAGGTAQEVADKKLAGLTGAWTKLKSATEGVFIEIGTRLSPVLERLAALLTDRVLPAVRGALEMFDRLWPGMQTAVIAATAVTAALGPLLIVVGGVTAALTPLLPVLVALGKTKAVVVGLAAVKTVLAAVGITATTTWAAILGPITLVVAGIAAVALAFTHWDAIRETLGLVESQAVTTTDKLEEARTALERMSKTSRRANIQRRRELKAEIAALEAQVAEQDRIQASWEKRKAGWDRDRLARDAKTAAAEAAAAEAAAVTAAAVARQAQAVQDLVDRLRGTGAIQAAHNWAAALDQVGGLTTLTDDATRQLVGTFDTAIAHLRALGKAVPTDVFERYMEASDRVRLNPPEQVFTQVGFEIADLHPTAIRAAHAQRMQAFRAMLDTTRLRAFADMGPIGIPLEPDLPPSFSENVQARFTGFAAEIGPTFARALEGGGNFLGAAQSLGVQGGSRLGEALSGGLATKMAATTGFFSKGIGKFFGQAMGQAIPFIGPIVGLGIGKIFGLFKKPSEAELAARKHAKDYEDTIIKSLKASQLKEAAEAAQGHWAGNERGAQFLIGVRDAYVAAGKSAAEGEAIVGRYWKAVRDGSPEAVAAITTHIDAVVQVGREQQQRLAELGALKEAGQAAFDPAQIEPYLATLMETGVITAQQADQLRGLADEAHVDHEAMAAAAERYGVKLSALGPAFDQARISDAATVIVKDFELMTQEGADVNGVLRGMQDEVQALVTDALTAGVAIPEGMRPILESLIAQGRLTDEDGTKLEDLSRIDFAAPLAEKFDTLIEKLTALIDKIAGRGGVTEAIEGIPREVEVGVDLRYREHDRPEGFAGVDVEYARHGTPFRQFGGGTPAMLHGFERVMTGMEGRGIAAALGRIQQGLGAIADLSGVRALAKGGLVTRPTLALIGEREPEAVLPQSQIGRLGTSVQVHVDARGALFTDEYTSQRELARIVSDAIVSDLEGTRRLGLH